MPIHRVITVSRLLTRCSNTSCMLVNPKIQENYNCRFISVETPRKAKALKTEKEKIRMYVVQRYIDYVNNYTALLEKRFPTAVKMYRVFSIGIKDFLRDLKTYIMLRVKMTRDKGFSKMSRQDIELYQKMPSDMCRIAPVLILSAIPFGNYIIFPLAFLKPRILLCSHFWSIQQRVEFSRQELTERLRHNKPVFRALQAKLDTMPDGDLKRRFRTVVGLLGSGAHPSTQDILNCKELFSDGPYQLSQLTYAHMGFLLKMHGLRKGLLRQNKLKYRAFLLMEMDRAILREGGVECLNLESLRNACHIRGLNSSNLTHTDMRRWLQRWIHISQHIDKHHYSLLLHTPVFLAYNHPQNWVLIY